MDCNQCSDILSFYVLNELTQTEAEEVAKHLAECESCSKQAKELSALLSKMSSIEAVEPPVDFLEKVTKKAEKELWINKTTIIKYTTFLKIASIAAIFAVSFIAFRQLDNFRSKTESMSMTSSDSTAAYGKANGSTEKNAVNSSSDSKADIANKALQDSNLGQTPQNDSTTPKVAYEVTPGTGNVSRASNYAIPANDIYPSTTPEAAEKGIVDQPQADGKLTVTLSDKTVSDTKVPDVSASTNDMKKPDEANTAMTITSDNTVSVASVLSSVGFAETQVQIKAKDKAAAKQWIKDQAQKVNGAVVPNISIAASSLTTQESTYATPKAIASERTAADGDKIILDVNKENADKFKNSIIEYFGKDNVILEENNISSDTVRFIIVINE